VMLAIVPKEHGEAAGMEANISMPILDAIQGHSGKSASDGYGDVTIAAMAAAIAKLPRYAIYT
jgi:hypothetical protein